MFSDAPPVAAPEIRHASIVLLLPESTRTVRRKAAAVQGHSRVDFGNWQEVQTELRLTPFAAKKAISLRDALVGM